LRNHQVRGDLALTELGLGAAQLGNLYRATTDAEAADTVDAAWSLGIRYFDTAPHYGLGLSERRLGALLASYPRDDYVLSTKVGRLLTPHDGRVGKRDSEGFDVPADAVRRWDFSRDGILRSVETSLERTGLDRFDILYLHDPDNHFEQASTEGIATLIQLRDEGVVRAVGAGMNSAGPLAELIRRADVDVVMCAGRFTLLDHSAASELLPLAHERGVGVVAAGVFNSGLLSSRRPSPSATYDYGPAPTALIARANAIADICERHGITLPELAIAYPFRHPAIASVVVGARGRGQVEQNVSRARTPIPDALWQELIDNSLITKDPA